MELAHKVHLERIQKEVLRRIEEKYKKGQAEHGGNLWEVPILELLEEALGETIDQATYLITAIDNLKQEISLRNQVATNA